VWPHRALCWLYEFARSVNTTSFKVRIADGAGFGVAFWVGFQPTLSTNKLKLQKHLLSIQRITIGRGWVILG